MHWCGRLTDLNTHTQTNTGTHTHEPNKPLKQKKEGSKKTKKERAREDLRELGTDNDDATESVMKEVERGKRE